MPKSKTFKSTHSGSIAISVFGGTPIPLEPGGTYTTDNLNEIEALERNPDVQEQKSSSKGSDREK